MIKASIQRVAQVGQDFLKIVTRFTHKEIWRTPKYKGGKKWLTVKATVDPDKEYDPFFYVERLGQNSVAFVLIDQNRPGEYGLLQQWHGPNDKFVTGAYTGSFDKELEGRYGIVVDEVREEAGYEITEDRIIDLGSVHVLTCTNEVVFLHAVDVTGLEAKHHDPENIFEANMNFPWVRKEEVLDGEEFRAIAICSKLERRL